MTWQFWTALAAFALTAFFGIHREIVNRRFVREYVKLLWTRELSALQAEQLNRRNQDDTHRYGTQRHLFGIVEGYREARHEAERYLRRDW